VPSPAIHPTLPPLTVMGWLRRDTVMRLADRVQPDRVLEIGAGQGAMGCRLANRFTYTAVEPDDRSRRVAEERLRSRPNATCVASLNDLGPAEQFDLVCCFEVLEHVEDDKAALVDWIGHTTTGGHVLFSVPAHRRRFSPSDIAAGHHRRYDHDDLTELLAAADLEPIEILSYGAGLGHLVEAAWDVTMRRASRTPAAIEERSAASGRLFQPSTRLGGAARAFITLPFRAAQRPFEHTGLGVGWICLARSEHLP
jgi:SAM-dependent methyltransferase